MCTSCGGGGGSGRVYSYPGIGSQGVVQSVSKGTWQDYVSPSNGASGGVSGVSSGSKKTRWQEKQKSSPSKSQSKPKPKSKSFSSPSPSSSSSSRRTRQSSGRGGGGGSTSTYFQIQPEEKDYRPQVTQSYGGGGGEENLEQYVVSSSLGYEGEGGCGGFEGGCGGCSSCGGGGTGVPGPPGPEGPEGPQGEQGPQGDPGEPGFSTSFAQTNPSFTVPAFRTVVPGGQNVVSYTSSATTTPIIKVYGQLLFTLSQLPTSFLAGTFQLNMYVLRDAVVIATAAVPVTLASTTVPLPLAISLSAMAYDTIAGAHNYTIDVNYTAPNFSWYSGAVSTVTNFLLSVQQQQ